ncbi:hypothetical protein TRFO_19424 [Tritrichomonas foetus]|uniref:CCR4-Not complex component Not1 C-terminal domain-containing protein n=1 Tax=Tritrichomonas foetus TaxID=1144522 RepID=A0A1J4KI24_9EUKA|nr:hypothetical protein TRFO_19424 [Tritrichomonas foetus]|eukprot:OHT11033.1 hypothetical protein TRFO_19424 [Tritrichomonas foetus]
MKRCRYPSTVARDFDSNIFRECQKILSLPLPKIYKHLIQILDDKNNAINISHNQHNSNLSINTVHDMKLLCILRYILDIPPNESTVVLFGWYVINNLVPLPTIFYYVHQLTMLLPDGISLFALFAQAIITRLPKYCFICKYLLSLPSLQFTHNELHIVLSQVARDSFPFEICDHKNHYVIPTNRPFYPEIRTITAPPLFPLNAPLIQLKPNIFASIEFAATLPADDQRLFCVNLCLTYSPPSVKLRFLPLLSAACGYTRLLLFDSSHLAWSAFEIHPQLERMANWISALSVEHGPPPPLYLLNIPLLVRECAAIGSLSHCLVFLIALFSKTANSPNNQYNLPNPLTVSILSVLAAVYNVKGIRTDIKALIEKFCGLFKTEINYFYSHDILIPPNSFDISANFQSVGAQSIFQPSAMKNLNNKSWAVHDSINDSVVHAYFHYVPNRGMLPLDLQELCANAQKIEKYYFVDGTSHTFRSFKSFKSFNTIKTLKSSLKYSQESDQEMLQCFVSLALADSPILAKNSAVLFKKATKRMTSMIDLCPLFRCAFPNRYILAASLERNCFAPEDVNSLFSELLTNSKTAPIAGPMISSFMPMVYQFCKDYPFTSVKLILSLSKHSSNPLTKTTNTNFISGNNRVTGNLNQNANNASTVNDGLTQERVLPTPLKSHAPILKSFLEFSVQKTENTRNDFLSKVSKASVPQIISLFSFVFGVTQKKKSAKCPTTTDYSAIDGLCWSLGLSDNRFNNDKLNSNCFSAATAIAPESPPLLLFRLINGLLTHLQVQSKYLIKDLLENLSPSKMPSFAICWMQLVMHHEALPSFIDSNDRVLSQFCLNFLLLCIKLIIIMPDVFYRGVTRIFMTVASSAPKFLVSYHSLLLENLPFQFIQIRNIILNATPTTSEIVSLLKQNNSSLIDDFAIDINEIESPQESEKVNKLLNHLMPPIGFNYEDSLHAKGMCVVTEKAFQSKETASIAKFISTIIKRVTNEQTNFGLTLPKVIYQFVLFSMNKEIHYGSQNNQQYGKINNNNKSHNKSGKNLIQEMFIAIQNLCDEKTLVNLYNAILDQIRYPNIHTTIASELITKLFERGNKFKRELIYVTILKRMMCVTQPPTALKITFKGLATRYKKDIERFFRENGEISTYNRAQKFLRKFM